MRTEGQPRISDEQVLGALLREHFSLFLQMAYAELHGGRSFLPNWHIDAIEHQLDRVRLGTNRRLVVTMPPRHLKSITITTAWVAWMLGKNPRLKFICASYGLEFADKPARDCLKIMTSDWYRRAFPRTKLTRRAVLDLETSQGGGRLSTSVGGVVTGRGSDIIIIDDPMKASDALSEAARKEVSDWFKTSLDSRLDDQATGSIILVMQRLHEHDLAGELLRRGDWDELRLSAIATVDELVPLTRGRMHQRRVGYPLHGVRQSLALLAKKQADEPYVFAAHYQQDPVARIGAFVRQEWLGRYQVAPATGTTILSCDTAVKTTVRSDWSVLIAARYYQGRFYILDVLRRRMEFGALKDAVCSMCVQHGVNRLLIEDASSGASLIQQLGEKHLPGVPWPFAITPVGDKVTRFEAIASKIQSGAVVLPQTSPWEAVFVGELTKFPGGDHDDQADALAQMLANPPPSREPPINAGPELIGEGNPLMHLDFDYGLSSDVDPWGA